MTGEMGDAYSLTNLIINYLPQRMSDDDFKKLFGSVGSIKSCRIIRDKTSGISYGFGFCEYDDTETAQKAIDVYNGYQIENKILKVAFARLPGQESKNCNLYLQNLPTFVGREDLENRYSKYGKIVQCRLVKDKSGKSRRIGFVLFECRSSAEQAMQFTNNKPWPNSNSNDGVIQVRFADDNSKKVRTVNPGVNTNTTQTILPNNSFGKPGTWNEPFQFANNGSGTGGGPMRHSGMYYGAGNRFNPMMGTGSSVNPVLGGFAPSLILNDNATPSSQNSGHVVYVYNCGNISNEKLIALFAQFGAIVKADIPRDSAGTSKNFGFVTFLEYNCAMKAITCMHGYNLNGKALQVSLKKEKHSA